MIHDACIHGVGVEIDAAVQMPKQTDKKVVAVLEVTRAR